jgi:hypothetical protein
MRVLLLAVALAAVGASRSAAAAPSGRAGAVALTYTLEAGTGGCPDERWIRQSVAGRLGYDPFDLRAPLRVEARISRVDRALVGNLEVTDETGELRGRRQLTSSEGDCLELASAMELAIAIAVDPLVLTRPEPAPPVTAPAPEPEPPPAPAAPPPVSRPGPAFLAGVGLLGSAGVSPSPVAGFSGVGIFRWERFSLALEGRADLTSTVAHRGGTVSSSVLLASAVPCAHLGGMAACAVVSAGALRVTGQFVPPARRVSSPMLLGGVRVQAELPLGQRFVLLPWVQGQAVLSRTTVLSGEETVWVTAPFTGALGLAAAVRFR